LLKHMLFVVVFNLVIVTQTFVTIGLLLATQNTQQKYSYEAIGISIRRRIEQNNSKNCAAI